MFDFDSFISNPTLAFLASEAALIIICLVAVKVISTIASKAFGRSGLDSGISGFLNSAVRIALWGIAVMIVAESLGVPVNSLVAALGVAGLALSLSIQNLLSNLFSGVQIISTRPFAAGDYVEIGSVAGTVSEIRLFQTKLRAPDNRVILVPNGQISASTIINYSSESERRLELRFPLPARADPRAIREAVTQALSANARVLASPAPVIAPDSFTDGRAEYIVRVWVRTTDVWDARFELNEAIPLSLRTRGIPLAVPGLNVSVAGAEPDIN